MVSRKPRQDGVPIKEGMVAELNATEKSRENELAQYPLALVLRYGPLCFHGELSLKFREMKTNVQQVEWGRQHNEADRARLLSNGRRERPG